MEINRKINDEVNHPAHYTAGKVECIDAIESATQGLCGVTAVCAGQVIKYIWRYSRKGTPEKDLAKADFYLQKLRGIIREQNTLLGSPDTNKPTPVQEALEETIEDVLGKYCHTGTCED